MTRRLMPIALTAATAAVLSACAGAPAPPPHEARQDIDFVSPALRGAENGLELHWWVVQSSPDDLRDALLDYADASDGLCDTERAALESQGLRLVRVPLEEVSPLRESLRVRGRTERKWLGQAPWWIEALRGAMTGETLVCTDGAAVTLPSGRLRVLARAWTAPAAAGPVMRTDLAIQHLPRTAEVLPNFSEQDARRVLEPQHQGTVFDRTVSSLEMHEGYAYLLVCDTPGTPWGTQEPADAYELTYGVIPATECDRVGPPVDRIPSIGERLLRQPAPHYSGEHPLTAVVVLAPRLPETYTLLP